MNLALELPELRIIIFSFFDWPTLFAASLVCRAWSATGLPLLWREPPPHAYKGVSEGSRQWLQGEIRLLQTPDNLEDMFGWCFPKIDMIKLDCEIAKQAHAVGYLLQCSGENLRSVALGLSNAGKTWSESNDA